MEQGHPNDGDNGQASCKTGDCICVLCLKQPIYRITNCGHFVCKNCVQYWLEMQRRQADCPTCQTLKCLKVHKLLLQDVMNNGIEQKVLIEEHKRNNAQRSGEEDYDSPASIFLIMYCVSLVIYICLYCVYAAYRREDNDETSY